VRPINFIGVHEQHLIAGGEVFPSVVAVLLWRIVPDTIVGMITVINIDLASGLPGATGGDR
jgi:hypothetical protein